MRQMRRISFSSGLISGLVNFLYPSACPSCSNPSDGLAFAPFCTICWSDMPQYCGPSCRICGVPLVSSHAHCCRNCLALPPFFVQAMSFGLYDAALAAAIHHFKFLGIRRLSGPLAELLFFYDTSGIDVIVPVPLSPKALRDRGFNQALLLAYRLSKKKRLPLVMDSLRKVVDTPPQVGLSAKERAANVRKAFTCTGGVSGLKILLVDDVMTTGATVNACAAQLLNSGARSVHVLTLARAGIP
jgi:ComF family protein